MFAFSFISIRQSVVCGLPFLFYLAWFRLSLRYKSEQISSVRFRPPTLRQRKPRQNTLLRNTVGITGKGFCKPRPQSRFVKKRSAENIFCAFYLCGEINKQSHLKPFGKQRYNNKTYKCVDIRGTEWYHKLETIRVISRRATVYCSANPNPTAG